MNTLSEQAGNVSFSAGAAFAGFAFKRNGAAQATGGIGYFSGRTEIAENALRRAF